MNMLEKRPVLARAGNTSDGQQQRVAIARALAVNTSLLLAERCDKTIQIINGKLTG